MLCHNTFYAVDTCAGDGGSSVERNCRVENSRRGPRDDLESKHKQKFIRRLLRWRQKHFVVHREAGLDTGLSRLETGETWGEETGGEEKKIKLLL